MRYLLTPSLYNSWHYYHSADDDRQDEARRDLITTLRREQIPPTAAMLAGRNFEDDVASACEWINEPFEDRDPDYQDCVIEVADIVRGGLWQERIYHDLHFRDHGDFLLFGKADVIKGPWIYDIKFTKNYDIGKYRESIQHTAYLTGSRLKRFAYLVSDGRHVWREDYVSSQEASQQMRASLVEMLEDIKRDRELAGLYETHWGAR